MQAEQFKRKTFVGIQAAIIRCPLHMLSKSNLLSIFIRERRSDSRRLAYGEKSTTCSGSPRRGGLIILFAKWLASTVNI
jgi:hypothetical protein